MPLWAATCLLQPQTLVPKLTGLHRFHCTLKFSWILERTNHSQKFNSWVFSNHITGCCYIIYLICSDTWGGRGENLTEFEFQCIMIFYCVLFILLVCFLLQTICMLCHTYMAYTVGPGLSDTDLSENLSYPTVLHRTKLHISNDLCIMNPHLSNTWFIRHSFERTNVVR